MKRTLTKVVVVCMAFAASMSSCKKNEDTAAAAGDAVDTTAVATAEKAFLYGYSLVIMDLTRKKLTNYVKPESHGAPINQFGNMSSFPDYTFKDVVRPNADTYYSTAFCDLSKDALVFSVPATNGRYYMVPMLDAYSNVFNSPGSRTTGDKAGTFLITGPKWSGTVPAGMQQIKAPTEMIWILGRIQCNGKEDGIKVVIPIQKQLKLTPLSSWGKAYTAPDGTVDATIPKEDPNAIVGSMPIDQFFNYANQLMVNNAPAAADAPALAEFAKIGVAPGGKFDLSKFNSATQAAMNEIPKKVYAAFNEQLAKPKNLVNGWNILIDGMGSYGTNYAMRSLVTYVGLGANLPQDAIYPSNSLDQSGKPYNGANKYMIHFAKGETPPVNGFWSLTMYDQQGYFIENPINVYAVGHGAPFTYNADGSLDIYIQNESPGKDKQNNWLPAPKGEFNVMMRTYWPKESMINRTWSPPAITTVK